VPVPPLPPVVDGPIYEVPHAQIHVDNVLPDSVVRVFSVNPMGQIGQANSSEPGDIWVPTSVPVAAGQAIVATQTYTGNANYIDATPGISSAVSNVPIDVLPVPDPLPVPVFLSAVSQCSDSVWIGSLIQGCTLRVWQGGNPLVDVVVVQPSQWFTLAATALTPGVPLQAQQEFLRQTSLIGSSLPVFAAPPNLTEPVISLPIRACQTALGLSGMTPGANLEVTYTGTNAFATSPWESYTLVDLPPLKPGQLTAQQYFTRCPDVPKSPVATYTVTTPPLAFPAVSYPLCQSVTQFTVSGLTQGDILNLQQVVQTGPGTETVSDIGSQGVSGTVATVNLPPTFSPTDPRGPVSIRIAVFLCGLETVPAPGYVLVHFSTAPGLFPPAIVQPPLYECAMGVLILGAHPGSLIQVFSGSAAHPRCNPVVATAADFVVALWSPLVKEEMIFVQQQGCHADGTSKPVIVQPIPDPLPSPDITMPVRAAASAVDVTGVIPGAQVYLYVDGVYRSHVETFESSASLPCGSPPLVANQHVQVFQAICNATSAMSDAGPGYAVVTPQPPVPPPPNGLGSSSNYILYSNCNPLTDVSVIIDINQSIDATNGFSFQLNAYSLNGFQTVWQQFVIALEPNSATPLELICGVNLWTEAEINSTDPNQQPEMYIKVPQLPPLASPTLPAPYSFQISLANGTAGAVPNCITGVNFTITDNTGATHTNFGLDFIGQLEWPPGDLAPITAFEVNLVGPDKSQPTVLSSGAGQFVYNATTPLTVLNQIPTQCTGTNTQTGETANSTYGPLPPGPSNIIHQAFSHNP
jgi:hypothetical protein